MAEEAGDCAEVGPLLDWITGAVASFAGDGGHGRNRVCVSVAERHPDAAVVVPPHVIAGSSETAAAMLRDRRL